MPGESLALPLVLLGPLLLRAWDMPCCTRPLRMGVVCGWRLRGIGFTAAVPSVKPVAHPLFLDTQ